MVIGTALGWSNAATIALAIVLAFVFGYSFTVAPVLRAGLGLGAALGVALAADTLSITVMEIVDNAVLLVIPGAMDAGLDSALFWGSLAFALAVAFVVTVPVNRALIARGRGHAVVHRYHHTDPAAVSASAEPAPGRCAASRRRPARLGPGPRPTRRRPRRPRARSRPPARAARRAASSRASSRASRASTRPEQQPAEQQDRRQRQRAAAGPTIGGGGSGSRSTVSAYSPASHSPPAIAAAGQQPPAAAPITRHQRRLRRSPRGRCRRPPGPAASVRSAERDRAAVAHRVRPRLGQPLGGVVGQRRAAPGRPGSAARRSVAGTEVRAGHGARLVRRGCRPGAAGAAGPAAAGAASAGTAIPWRARPGAGRPGGRRCATAGTPAAEVSAAVSSATAVGSREPPGRPGDHAGQPGRHRVQIGGDPAQRGHVRGHRVGQYRAQAVQPARRDGRGGQHRDRCPARRRRAAGAGRPAPGRPGAAGSRSAWFSTTTMTSACPASGRR